VDRKRFRSAPIGDDDGRLYRSDVRPLVACGLVLLREVGDAELDGLGTVAEAVEPELG
jgi:hypothetical protein